MEPILITAYISQFVNFYVDNKSVNQNSIDQILKVILKSEKPTYFINILFIKCCRESICIDFCKFLLDKYNNIIDINFETDHGSTPLNQAAIGKNLEMIEILTSFPNIKFDSVTKNIFLNLVGFDKNNNQFSTFRINHLIKKYIPDYLNEDDLKLILSWAYCDGNVFLIKYFINNNIVKNYPIICNTQFDTGLIRIIISTIDGCLKSIELMYTDNLKFCTKDEINEFINFLKVKKESLQLISL